MKNRSSAPTQYIPAFIVALLLTSLVPLLFYVIPAQAIQPAFIKGTVFNTFNNTLVTGAVIYTANGVSTAASNGAYVLRVPPSIYTIIATAPDCAANLLSGIPATPGNIALVNIGITPASTPVGYVEGYIVRSSTGEGIQGALITTNLGGAAISSGRDGGFRLSSPSGAVTITVSADGFSSKYIEHYTIYPYVTTNRTMDLNEAPATRIAVKGIIKDACTGIRLNNAIIISNSGQISSSSDGFYSIDTPVGQSTIIVSADGYQFSSQTFFLSPFSIKTYDFSLIPATSGSGLIRGFITNSDTGAPLADVRIEADIGTASSSNKDGAFKLYSSICTTSLFASKKGFQPALKSVSVSQGTVTTINFSMQPLGIITGSIRDIHSGCGIKGASITLMEDTFVSCTSSSDGSYQLKDIVPGNHTINISHSCYLPELLSVVVVSGDDPIKQDVLLEAPAVGTVYGAIANIFTRKPISSVVVRTSYGATAATDEEGLYTLDIPVCSTDITIGAPGYLAISRKNISPSAAAPIEVNATLIPWPLPFFLSPQPDNQDF